MIGSDSSFGDSEEAVHYFSSVTLVFFFPHTWLLMLPFQSIYFSISSCLFLFFFAKVRTHLCCVQSNNRNQYDVT